MKHLITVTLDSPDNDSVKRDTGIIYQGIAKALPRTNGSEVHIYTDNAENKEAMRFLTRKLLIWSGVIHPQPRKRTVAKRKGWLAKARDEFMQGLTG